MFADLDIETHSLEQLVAAAQQLAEQNPAETARIYAEVVDRVCEFEEKLRYQNLSTYYEKLAHPDTD